VREAFLGLGSNLGDRARHLAEGLRGLGAGGVEVLALSPVYETEPMGFPHQPPFLNLVCRVRTALPPRDVLRLAKAVEWRVGRRPTFRNGPRVLDIDLLLYGEEVVEEPGLSLPHPRLAERAFVLVPLADLAPEVRHPTLGLTAREMRDRLPLSDRAGVRRWEGHLPPWR